ncbi:hypothetical protein PVK06_038893 [Gossypium arboreum]|uniref:Uncharacterized protein n=1 Tax=Gossypium arboreum TaxID=29729 RepID=A0ABR0N1E5_GOSAR|nr:hypothetical protein PVK06_038893 [Gossypium arboreum]
MSLAMRVLMIMVMLVSTNQYCAADAVKKNKSISSRWCDDSSNKECLQLSDDIETMELLMDSEASKMVFEASAATNFANSKNPTTRALDPSQAACGRNTGKSCLPASNTGTKRFLGNMGDCRRILGGFNLAILMVMLLLSTDRHCAADAVKKNKNIGSRWCGGSLNKEECLQLSDDMETMELLMASEVSKMVFEASAAINFAGSKRPTTRALVRSQAACDRNTGKRCVPDSNSGRKKPPNCSLYNRDCH